MKTLSKIPVLFLLAFIAGCGLQGENSSTEPVVLDLSSALSLKSTLLSDLKKVDLTIRASDIAQPITAALSAPFSGSVAFSVDVPVGTKRDFQIDASLNSSTNGGLRGHALGDIVQGQDNQVPVTLRFLNAISEATGDTTNPGDPDIVGVNVRLDDKGTADTSDDDLEIETEFASSVDRSPLLVLLEFDTDDNASTGRSQTIIDSLIQNTSIKTGFKKGSEIYILFQSVPNGADPSIFIVSIFDSNDKTITPGADAISGNKTVFTAPNKLSIRASRKSFTSIVDSDGSGAMSILVGTQSGHDLAAPAFRSFVPGDVADGGTGLDPFNYDIDFNPSKL